MAKMLMLRLEGVLQSWGEHSRFDSRDSASMPTKSGVVGCSPAHWAGPGATRTSRRSTAPCAWPCARIDPARG